MNQTLYQWGISARKIFRENFYYSNTINSAQSFIKIHYQISNHHLCNICTIMYVWRDHRYNNMHKSFHVECHSKNFSRASSPFDVCFRQCYLFFHLVLHLVCRWLLFPQSFYFTNIISKWWWSWIKSVRILLGHNKAQFILTIDTFLIVNLTRTSKTQLETRKT